jgi:hypothetical protein
MIPTQDSSLSENTGTENNIGQGIILSYNFETGEFNMKDGKVIELTGLEGLKMWVQKVLRTEKHKFKIYTGTDSTYAYGISLLEYLNSDLPYDFIKAEIQREITETLLNNKAISSITDFSFERVNDILNVSFTINSTYGTTTEGVSLNAIK